MSHTAGPWRPWRINGAEQNRIGNVVDTRGKIICTFHAAANRRFGDGEVTANALLIAAAPDLRNAWEAGRVTIPGPDFLEWVAARCMRFEGLDPDGATEVDYAVRLRAMSTAARAAIAKAEGK